MIRALLFAYLVGLLFAWGDVLTDRLRNRYLIAPPLWQDLAMCLLWPGLLWLTVKRSLWWRSIR